MVHTCRSPLSNAPRHGAAPITDVRERGQAAVALLVTIAAMTVMLLSGLVSVGGTASDRVRAQTAADAAALGSLAAGRAVAVSLAAEHGAVLESWRRGPGPRTVTVIVSVGDERATARAQLGD